MSEKLSQGEIEGLMQTDGASAGAAPTAEVEPRDFRRPLVCSRKEIEKLKGVFGGVCQELGKKLGEMLKISVQAELVSLEQSRFETALGALAEPCCAYRVKMEPLPAPALLAIDPTTALAAIDRLLGGSGKAKFEPRELRSAEKPIVDRMASRAAEAAAKGLAGVLKFNPSLGGLANSRKEALFLEPSDAVLAAQFGLSGDLPAGEIRLVIPFANLASLVGRGKGPAAAAGKAGGAQANVVPPVVAAAVRPFPVETSATLGVGRILVGELMMLEPGDVVPLETCVGERAVVSIAGIAAFEGRVGVKEGKFAVEIEAAIPGGRIGGKKK